MGKSTPVDLAENLTQCREYHREQICNWSKVGRSLGLTCAGQKVSLVVCKWNQSEREKSLHHKSQGPFSFARLFNRGAELAYLTSTGYRSNQVTYRLLTHYKVIPYDILYIVSNFQPNRTEVDFPIGLVRCPLHGFL